MNERITEELVRDLFRNLDYRTNKDIQIEEQKSQIEEVKRLLKGASKTGGSGSGYPEFIISSPETPDFLVVVECKADTKFHESKNLDKQKDYALDGVLHYAKKLSKSYYVIAVAVSGQSKSSLKVSTYIHQKGDATAKELKSKSGKSIRKIISWKDYIDHGTFNPEVAKKRHDDLMGFSRSLHNFMRDHAKLTESEKPLLVSGTLIALRNKAFSKSYDEHTPEDLQKEWMKVIKTEFRKADIPNSKEYSMTQPYSSIAVHPELGKPTKKYPKGVLFELSKQLNERVWPFISIYHDFDVVGQFYGEFLKYTGGDKKSLGIVLTPKHITELFSLLANVQKDTVVLDICAGTGGFLISAMHQMFKKAVTEKDKKHIKKSCLIGIEQQPNMYTLSASNMILRGDGKANMHQGSCFDEGICEAVKKAKCTTGLLNPPYSQGDEDLHELVFVKHMLDLLEKDSLGIAIIPISCVIANHPMKEEILKHHTLEAVMSMPEELFSPVGTVTCIVIFSSHTPHDESDKNTWFGYWRDDGFTKTKHKGRIDLRGTWAVIRDKWVSSFRNREVIDGFSISRKVAAQDEWCAEAYMKTDYSTLKKNEFEKVVREYFIFKSINEDAND